MAQKTRDMRHVCDFYFIVTSCRLSLTLNAISLLMQYLLQTLTSTLSEFELYAARPTDPRAQHVKTLHIDL